MRRHKLFSDETIQHHKDISSPWANLVISLMQFYGDRQIDTRIYMEKINLHE